MKRELNDLELEEVVGGTVTLSAPTNKVIFSAIRRSFQIKGDIKQMRNLMLSLYDEHGETMSNEEFDRLVMNEYAARGWI